MQNDRWDDEETAAVSEVPGVVDSAAAVDGAAAVDSAEAVETVEATAGAEPQAQAAASEPAKKPRKNRSPEGIVPPRRHHSYSVEQLAERFVSSASGESFAELAEDADVDCDWKCPRGHVYTESRASHRHSRGCPTCAVAVATRMPGLLRYWDSKNNSESPDDVSAYSRDKVYWVCEHGHGFQRPPYRVLATGHQCQECRRDGRTPWRIAGKRDAGLTFADAFPDIAAQWDYERNPRGPEEYAPGSQRVAHWVCENGHSWSSPICHRTSTARHPASCQHCKAIAFSAPELAAELHPTLNPPDTAETQRKGSSDVLYWECERGHVFTASVAARLRSTYPASCDRCRAIAVKAPDLIDACWAYERNAEHDPELLKTSSADEVWWVRMDSLAVPVEDRRELHYEKKRIGYRYRRYLNNPEREVARIREFLSKRASNTASTGSGNSTSPAAKSGDADPSVPAADSGAA